MKFTKQDFITFALGFGMALLLEVGQRLYQLDPNQAVDWNRFAWALAVGILTAAGRYLVTRLPELIAKIGD